MRSIELTAYAKVNLYLKILGKRRDSYHNIRTLFERVSLCDRVKISRAASGISISSDKPITKYPKDNLAYKAADLLLKYKRVKGGVNIRIEKNIPIAGGLGGGSSDAAAVLKGINILYGLKLSTGSLMKLGSRLGADVPFFISDEKFAIGSGKGDKLRPVRPKLRLWHLLINPGFAMPTRGIYQAFDAAHPSNCLTRGLSGAKITSLLEESMDFGIIEPMLRNDLESAAVVKKAVLGSTIRRLAALLGKKAIVSGSGPSLFCLYGSRKEAARARSLFLSSLPARTRKIWQAFAVTTC